MVGNKIADKISVSNKKATKKLPTIDEDAELSNHKKDIYHRKKDNKLLMN